MTATGSNDLASILEADFGTATNITNTVLDDKTDIVNIEANTTNKVDDSDTNRTIIIVGGVVATVLLGIVLYGTFVKK